MSKTENGKRIAWIELAQIISMVLIVYHHSMPNFTSVHPLLSALGSTVQYPSLAVFFALGSIPKTDGEVPLFCLHRARQSILPRQNLKNG